MRKVIVVGILFSFLSCKKSPEELKENHPPEIIEFSSKERGVPPGGRVKLILKVKDRDGDELYYNFKMSFGKIEEGYFYRAPLNPPDTSLMIYLTVSDNKGGKAKDSLLLLTNLPNKFPVIDSLFASKETLSLDEPDSCLLFVYAHDPDGDSIYYDWSYHSADDNPLPYAYLYVKDSMAIYYPGPCCATPVYIVIKTSDKWDTFSKDSVLIRFK